MGRDSGAPGLYLKESKRDYQAEQAEGLPQAPSNFNSQ
jgi:hypothetical protein